MTSDKIKITAENARYFTGPCDPGFKRDEWVLGWGIMERVNSNTFIPVAAFADEAMTREIGEYLNRKYLEGK